MELIPNFGHFEEVIMEPPTIASGAAVAEDKPVQGDRAPGQGAYRLNEPIVACEVLEGDLILLHFESGLYYNLRGMGAAICQHLLAGGGITAAIEGLTGHYGLPRAQVEREVRCFVAELVQEGLLIATEAAPEGRAMPVPPGDYEVPQCAKFDDLADQLLLDKIDDLAQDAQWGAPPAGSNL
jgi:hypothetical protein